MYTELFWNQSINNMGLYNLLIFLSCIVLENKDGQSIVQISIVCCSGKCNQLHILGSIVHTTAAYHYSL